VKDAPYTAKYGHPPEMKQGRGKGEREGEARHGKKEGEGGDGGCFVARGWKGEGRKEREGGMGN